VHSNLSEELLSGRPEPKSFPYSPSRRRFEIEPMPKRKAAEHEFHQDYSFSSAETKATSGLWYAMLARQPDMKNWLSTCQQIAFNLGEQCVSLDSLRDADEVTMAAVNKTAFTNMDPKLGPQLVLKRVFAATAARCAQPVVLPSLSDYITSCKVLMPTVAHCRSYCCKRFHRQAPW
jgi:hypothetical protein